MMDVFADFYGTLYSAKNCEDIFEHMDGEQYESIPPITTEEVKTQLDLMKKGKAADRSGMVVEMLQQAGSG
eukprot:12058627-Karenia_brevis.AAC.1